MSLRWRFALGLAVIAAIVGALGATGAYVTTRDQLAKTVDDSLLSRSAAVTNPGPRDRGPSRPAGDDDICPPIGLLQPTAAVQVVRPEGSVVDCVEYAPALPVDATDRAIAAGTGVDHRLRTVHVKGTAYRVLTVRLPDGGALQTARSLGETESVLSSLRLRLLALEGIAIVAAAGLGWLFARRILRPVDRLKESAEHIARTQDLETPLPAGGSGEIGSLARSLGTMVDALAVSRRQQQALVTDASHELRTPLTSLRTNAELLDRADRLTPEQLGRVSSGIRFEVDELTDLVSELVQLTNDRASTDETEERVALHELAEHVLDVTRRRTERPITIVHEGDDIVLARAHMTERAIANLVDNALKYSDGAVEIRVRGRRLEVRDHGPGIPAADQPKVFDRFFRSTNSRGAPGSGLGLSIVAQIVERHGGSVFATNDPEAGAVVGFELPAPRA